ncbi:MAG: response regulator transcription factor [Solibacillus sp.]
MMKKILVVEDEQNLASLLQMMLLRDGYEVHCVANGLEVLVAVENFQPDAILLDWMLPGIEGIELCRQLRFNYDFPILMMSARTDELDAVLALEMGATDYMRKPFGLRELLTRLRIHLRRYEKEMKQQERMSELLMGPFKVDFVTLKVYKENIEISLTQREYKLLVHLLERPGEVKSREEIIEVLNFPSGDIRTVDVHIRRLREKIEDKPSAPRWIKTKSGIGYYFNQYTYEVSYNS